MKMQDIAAAVEGVMKNMLYTVDTEAFIEKMIPRYPLTAQSFDKLKGTKHYIYEDSRWADFPEEPTSDKEKSLYKPFAYVSNAIVETISHEVSTKIVWLDRHSRAPKSLETTMAAARPNGVGAASDSAMDKLEVELHKLEELDEDVMSEQKRKREDLLLNYNKVWWMLIHVPHEIKPTRPGWYETVKKLLIYMRQMLMEQLDRRFVLGFILCFDELRLVLSDWSGVTLTNTPINIHKEPETFIRVISGFSYMNPEQLGWDTSMKIYRPMSDDAVLSYKIGPELQAMFGDGRYYIRWVIDVIENGQKVKYITVSIISALRSAEICGRATVVYEVIKFEERYDPTETRALKRYWRPIVGENPEDCPSEGEIDEILDQDNPDQAKYMFAFPDIKVNGQVDSTLKLLCYDLKAPFTHPVKTLPTSDETDADAEIRLSRSNVPENFPASVESSILTLVTNITGEVITMASSLRELVICFRGSIQDHGRAHEEGILHHDISAGNILISTNANGESFGRLMDYDHAKKAKSFSNLIPKTKDLSEEEVKRRQDTVRSIIKEVNPKLVVEDDVLREALRWVGVSPLAAYYVVDTVKMIQAVSGAQKASISMSDLRWNHEVEKRWPNFSDRTHRKAERTGTLSYMSGEVLARKSVVTPPHVPGVVASPFVHEAIHDLESFLWVLVRICMSRQGPGINMRRKNDLDPSKPNSVNVGLSDALMRYFEGTEDDLRTSKTTLLERPELFENEIVDYFHPYFHPLKPLVLQWWNILILGYRYRGDEFYNIHKHILRILHEALDKLSDESNKVTTTKKLHERNSRRQDRRARLSSTLKSTASARNASI